MPRQHVVDDMISWRPRHGGPVDRRAWIVEPPGLLRLVVVLEAPGEGGQAIQNGAEKSAEAVRARFPNHLTVLHYDQEQDAAWGNWWMPVPFDTSGKPVFGEDLHDHPAAEASLPAAGLLP